MKWKIKVTFLIVLSILTFDITYLSAQSSTSHTKKEKISKSKNIPLPDYEIVHDRTNDMNRIKVMVNQDIWVKNHIHPENLRKLLNQQYRKISERSGYKYFKHPTQIFIYLFTSKEKAQNSGANWVAMAATKVGGGGMEISISKTQLKASRLQPEEKFGLKEEERKEIWNALIKADDKAQKEADKKYPTDVTDPNYKQSNIEKNGDLDLQLDKEYTKAIEKKYNLQPGVLDSISNEGIKKGWSLPNY